MYRNDVGEISAGSSSLRSSQHSVLRVLRTVYGISGQYHHLFLRYTVTTSAPIRHVVVRQGRVIGTQKSQSQGKGKGKGKGGGSSTIRCRCGFLPKCVGKNFSAPQPTDGLAILRVFTIKFLGAPTETYIIAWETIPCKEHRKQLFLSAVPFFRNSFWPVFPRYIHDTCQFSVFFTVSEVSISSCAKNCPGVSQTDESTNESIRNWRSDSDTKYKIYIHTHIDTYPFFVRLAICLSIHLSS